MEKIGNSRANAYWEANVPPGAKPTASEEGDPAVAKYIRDKYELKKFCATDVAGPVDASGVVHKTHDAFAPRERVAGG